MFGTAVSPFVELVELAGFCLALTGLLALGSVFVARLASRWSAGHVRSHGPSGAESAWAERSSFVRANLRKHGVRFLAVGVAAVLVTEFIEFLGH